VCLGHHSWSKYFRQVFCSHPFDYRVTVVNSCLKTKHKAILASGGLVPCSMQATSRKKFAVFDLRDSNIDILRYYLNNCLYSNVYDCMDINVKFENFVATLLIAMS